MERVHKVILGVLAGILAVCIGVTVYLACTRGKFTPPPFDEAAVSGMPQVEDATLGYGYLALKDGFVILTCANPAVEDGNAVVYFTADAENTVWVRLVLLDENGEELGSTGLLHPGEYVRTIPLTREISEDTSIQLKILSYEPDTYYSMGAVAVDATLRAPKA